MLLFNAQCSLDVELQHVSAAALLAFSIQNECQIQIDAISGLSTLLRLLDCKDAGEWTTNGCLYYSGLSLSHDSRLAMVDLCVYAAATMWNICKSPLLMLKLEVSESLYDELLAVVKQWTDCFVYEPGRPLTAS